MADFSAFGCNKIKDKGEAIEWIRYAMRSMVDQGTPMVDILLSEAVTALEHNIDQQTLSSILISDVLTVNDEDDAQVEEEEEEETPARNAPLDYDSVGDAIREFLLAQSEPIPFRVIREFCEIHGGFDVTPAQWNVLNKKIAGLVRVGEKAQSKWKVEP
jgi:hypothetical protein